MIYIGDIACPYEKVESFISTIRQQDVFRDEVVVLNLEANILQQEDPQKPITLYNSPEVIKAFSNAKKVIVTLANNHMYDYPEHIIKTKELLEDCGCGVFGLSDSNRNTKPFEYEDNGIRYAFFGHCWRLYTHTNCNNENDTRISDGYYDEFCSTVLHYIRGHKGTKVYCFMHWNYDREGLVMPMHRKFARALIDCGVEGVIGSHSHRPQGAELYKGKPIVYGLGNFYLPSGIYFDGKLKYPEFSKETYALHIKDDMYSLIWFSTDKGYSPIEYIGTETFDGNKIRALSPFRELSDQEYLRYFKSNRSKSFLVPVFDDYKGRGYRMKEKFAIARVKMIKSILKIMKQ